jgi:PAS domain S-box-containing protein
MSSSPQLEQIVQFSVMSVLVMLFTWIYVRNREQRVGLWMLGWISVFVHFAAGLMSAFYLLNPVWSKFIALVTLEIAGTSFVLSVTSVFTTARSRIVYLFSFCLPSIFYLILFVWVPDLTWTFPTLIVGSTVAILIRCSAYYRRSRSMANSLLIAAIVVSSAWSAIKCLTHPEIGMLYYLTTFFSIAGLLCIQYYKRFTPGVVTTSASFLLWGLVFPLSAITHIPVLDWGASAGMLWNLPTYMVAFGMILTLFENQTEAATNAARQYHSLFERNLAAVYLSTTDGQLLDCNAAFVGMYGFSSKEEIQIRHTVNIYADPKDREIFVERLSKEGQVINYESRQRKRDGTVFWILERASLSTDSVGRRVIEGTAVDITERKQAELALRESEQRFATIYYHNPVGCGIVSLEGVFLSCNQALSTVLGKPLQEIVGKTSVELGLWKSQAERDKVYQRLRAEGSIRNMEIEFTDSLGNNRVGLYCGTLVRIADRECIFCMQLDLTEQRKLEAKFLQAQKMELVGRGTAGVAHDFNNLLGVIGSYAELLESHLSRDEKLRWYCNKITATAQRGSSLTRPLLTFIRDEINRPDPEPEPKPEPLDPNYILRDVAPILQRWIGEDIETILALDATKAVVIDQTHFESIIFNLVVNARDAMPAGGQLTIATNDSVLPASSCDGTPVRSVEIHVRDTGIGMDEATRRRAFEPFFTTKELGRGTGLGLAMVYTIIRQSGGDIDIQSRPGEGTQINISLPAIERVAEFKEKTKLAEPVHGIGHILLVEDEIELRNANAEFLTSIGYTVTCAASGVEALQLLPKIDSVQLVITDVVMPKMNGPEFAVRLREFYPLVKLLFVSGYGSDIVKKNGFAKSTIPFLQKPYTLRQLAAKIHEVLAGRNGLDGVGPTKHV